MFSLFLARWIGDRTLFASADVALRPWVSAVAGPLVLFMGVLPGSSLRVLL